MMWVSCFTRELRQLLRNIRATMGKSGSMHFFIGDKANFSGTAASQWLQKRNLIRVFTGSKCYEIVIYSLPLPQPFNY